MEELALQVRTFVYTMICFQCLIQLTAGNSFHKYLKFFTQLLALCICCNIFFSFVGIVDNGWEQADGIYEQWQEQWSGEEKLIDMEGYLGNYIVKESVKEFQSQIADMLQTKGKGNYVLKEVTQEEDRWRVIIKAKKAGGQEQQANTFKPELEEAICKEFSLEKEQVEVIVQ